MQWVMHNVQIAELTYIAAQLGTGQGCSSIEKKDPGSIFFLRPVLLDKLTYKIRNRSIYGNISVALPPRPRSDASQATHTQFRGSHSSSTH